MDVPLTTELQPHENPDGISTGRRVLVRVRGIVQGVGFRPYIYQLARRHQLNGWVRNQSDGVEIEVAGRQENVDGFIRDIPDNAPPLARIVYLDVLEEPYSLLGPFTIVESHGSSVRSTLISPDVCTCDECLSELLDPMDRRYRYPFINCTNCGPRYTIIRDIPYDRKKTTMAGFIMCPLCRREYEDPSDRRFHAQPNACPECGPHVWLTDHAGRVVAQRDDAVKLVVEQLNNGSIVAVKGLGGFHLAVKATDERAVSRLRMRKIREEKPFAVMFASTDALRKHCFLTREEETLLESVQRPIVLLKRRLEGPGPHIAPSAAPRNRFLGGFLPYTPLHRLLFEGGPCDALVMTSGNQSDEPIVMGNDEATEQLRGIADFFLLHNRDIYMRCDDSVTRVILKKPRPVRRARGYVPVPVFLASPGPSVLGVGAELKSTVCLTRRNEAFLSHHIGDLENLETLRSFQHAIEHLKRILEIEPVCIAHDLHPDYLSSQWAVEQEGVPLLAVQHHHSHIASVMAEQKLSGPVLGLALDGTGYGTDGTIWGGEILKVDGDDFERLGHLRRMPLPGGDRATREPWRMALSSLWTLDPENTERTFSDFFSRWKPDKTRIVLQMIRKGVNTPLTSSCGRLFDAVSGLIGLRESITYEGQAAIELEQAIEPEEGRYSGGLYVNSNGLWVMDPVPMLWEIVRDVRERVSPGVISARFHNGLVTLLTDAAASVSGRTGLKRVALSGGVFQNATLMERVIPALEGRGLEVLTHVEVPANDACIALGQAHVARERLKKRSDISQPG